MGEKSNGYKIKRQVVIRVEITRSERSQTGGEINKIVKRL
jgi:hypothetical protein